jgi:hypothetical protein
MLVQVRRKEGRSVSHEAVIISACFADICANTLIIYQQRLAALCMCVYIYIILFAIESRHLYIQHSGPDSNGRRRFWDLPSTACAEIFARVRVNDPVTLYSRACTETPFPKKQDYSQSDLTENQRTNVFPTILLACIPQRSRYLSTTQSSCIYSWISFTSCYRSQLTF